MAANRVKRRRAAVPLSPEQKVVLNFIYKHCPEGHEIDHIYPINGKNTCGLHAPWNLQWLPKEVNRTKSNKLPQNPVGYLTLA